jgi:hypothetical protein
MTALHYPKLTQNAICYRCFWRSTWITAEHAMTIFLTVVVLTSATVTEANVPSKITTPAAAFVVPRSLDISISRFASSNCCCCGTTNDNTSRRKQRYVSSHLVAREFHDEYSRNQWPCSHLRQYNRDRVVLFASYRPYDNLFSGLAEISLGFSIGVLWSEFSILLTGCGPTNLSDALERLCYQGVIVFAGVGLFNRVVNTATKYMIASSSSDRDNNNYRSSSSLSSSIMNEFFSPSNSLENFVEDRYGPLQQSTTIQVQAAELLSVLAVAGAVVVLVVQYYVRGTSMDGLSGINVDICRAMRDV